MADPSTPSTLIADALLDATLPEVVQRYLRLGHTLDDIRLDAHGRWWHNRTPITHPRLVTLFSRSIDRTPGGTWVLKIGATTYPIQIDAAPFFVHDFDALGDGSLRLSLSDDSHPTVSLSSLYAPTNGGLHAILPTTFHARWTLDAYIRFVNAHVTEDDAGQCVAVIGTHRHILYPPQSPPPVPTPHPNC